MQTVKTQLEEARKNLLDMSLRNKLLNFKEYKRSTAKIVDEVPGEVYQRLVIDEGKMSFLPAEDHPDHDAQEILTEAEAVHVDEDGAHSCKLCKEGEATFSDREGFLDHLQAEHSATIENEGSSGYKPEEMEELWELPEFGSSGSGRHIDNKLQTPHEESDLQKRLYNISNRADALIEDAGYNALHIALGFIEWTEAAAQEGSQRAPLILLPVELERKGARSAFKIRWNGEEVVGNLSLRHKLKEQGFELPDFEQPESPQGIREYLERVQEASKAHEEWTVRPEIHLGFFDFTKFVMYQDLDSSNWPSGSHPASHPILRALLDPEAAIEEPEPFDEDDIDTALRPEDVYHVKDADPSQIAAIEDVKRGRNLVIEGPPGTGKSQTIVNMIAELVAQHKNVLFVSEKLAALEVVKERLDEVKIGDFCLELHSDKASKADFLQELERLTKLGSYQADIPRETFDRLQQRKRELNEYAEALGTPFGKLARTPYDLIGQREEARRHFEDSDREIPRASIENPRATTPEENEAARSALETLDSRFALVHPIKDHPWYGCQPGQVFPQDQHEIEEQLVDALDSLQDLQESMETLHAECQVRRPNTLDEARHAIDAARLLRDSEPVDAAVLQNASWNTAPPAAEELISLLDRFHELRADVGTRTNQVRVDREPQELLPEYLELHDTWTRWFRPRWHRLRGRLKSLYSDSIPDDPETVVQDLEDLIELNQRREEIQASEDQATELFGSLWRGTETQPSQLEQFADWMVRFRQKLLNDVLEKGSIDLVTRGVSEHKLNETLQNTGGRLDVADVKLQTLEASIGLDSERVFDSARDKVNLEEYIEKLEDLKRNLDRLNRWSQFDQARSDVEETTAEPIVRLVDSADVVPGDLLSCYEANLSSGLLDSVFRKRPALAQFDGNVHEDRIESFQDLDTQTLEINRERVFSSLVERTPDLMRGASKESQAGILFHEFGKQRRHKPIRVLLEEAGNLIQKMKPCFMMSPLSVAKYLDPGMLDFDVVIFDEASQVPPEDALGAILRGTQLVVLGDKKQLPPTNFFNQVVDHREAEDEWGFNVGDMQSVLDLCRSAFPAKRLKWHYRSQHESLIAVSNQEFYDNDLLIYPSPIQDVDELGLRLEHLPDTSYDRGGSSVNREEAKAVAKAAVEHYRENPSKSLGIGTFSTAQQEAILEEVELLRKENAEIDKYFARGREEHFFVKNLERIQGDERDVIFISVGYGYDASGKFSHNFGPLNNQGGWRRLNVLITRSRQQCVVFSNFTADAIDLSSTNARGVEALKVFLDYAENRNLESLTEVRGETESPFEKSVKQVLEDEGYTVHAQVGAAGFRIDLAIPDPEKPGRYVLGIECDGRSYHSSPVARARDRQRESILEDRGWDLHRIWSTDWFRNRAETEKRLIQRVDQAIEEGPLKIGTPADRDSEPDVTNQEEMEEESNSIPSLEDLQSEGASSALRDLAQEYTPAKGLGFVWLSDHNIQETKRAVDVVVNEEGPIHRDLLAKRLREKSDVDRLGKKVQRTIQRAVNAAEREGRIDVSGKFLYPKKQEENRVRRRPREEAEIEWIPPEEIKEAARRILELQYATPMDELVTQVARLLGFARTGSKISDSVTETLREMIQKGDIEVQGESLFLPQEG